jgi:Domain of unknown function (DUF4399)
MKIWLAGILPGVLAALFVQPALAQKEEPFLMAVHPWQESTAIINPEAYFTNLPADRKIETPFLLKFGLSGGWGLAPIKKPLGGKSGHHHLLINTPLPLNIGTPIAFSEKYVHFGKGQMETWLNLEPGVHTLRLLLADHEHKLHFVYSKQQTITVTKKHSGSDAAKTAPKGVALLNVNAGDNLVRPFRLQFHASGFSVGHLQQKEPDSGHFRLTMVPAKRGKSAELDFTNGQTETVLNPPPGVYKVTLQLMDNTLPGNVLAQAPAMVLNVK